MSNQETNKPMSTDRRVPRVGQVVVYHQRPIELSLGNGAFEHPAIVTRVWGPDCVNLKVFPDCGTVVDQTSVGRAFHNGLRSGFAE